ncbi:hypothetical protein KR009_006212 [Drosophila setifemur]|nr:hypothetical protein KR009_006212 [Drosophila setifemur]
MPYFSGRFQLPVPPKKGLFEVFAERDRSPYHVPGSEEIRICVPPEQGGRDSTINWVVVSGFPREDEYVVERVMKAMGTFGRITDRKWSTLGLHLQYSHDYECLKAVNMDNEIYVGYRLRIQHEPKPVPLPWWLHKREERPPSPPRQPQGVWSRLTTFFQSHLGGPSEYGPREPMCEHQGMDPWDCPICNN